MHKKWSKAPNLPLMLSALGNCLHWGFMAQSTPWSHSCWAWSIHLTTLLLDRLSPLRGQPGCLVHILSNETDNCRDHFLARFRDILAFFLQEIASKFQEWEKKSHAEFFSFRAFKFLYCTCGSFRDYRTVLFDRFLNYCGAKIHYTYERR